MIIAVSTRRTPGATRVARVARPSAIRAASEAGKTITVSSREPEDVAAERPAKKRKTKGPARGKFLLDPDKISFNLDIKLVPQSEDDRLYALRLMDTYTKDVTAEQSEAIINTPRAEYLAAQTQKDRDALKKEHWAVQADILCKAPIASVRVDDVRYGQWSELDDLDDEAAAPPKLEDSAVIFEGTEFGFYDEKTEYELKEPLPDGKLTCAAFKDLVERFERESRTRQSQTGLGLDVSHVCFEDMTEVARNVYRIYWGS